MIAMLRLFRRKQRKTAAMAVRSPGKIDRGRELEPDVARLILGLIAATAMTVLLVYLNIRYATISTPTLEIAQPSLPALTEQPSAGENACPTPPSTRSVIEQDAPDVTFYERLATQEEPEPEQAHPALTLEPAPGSSHQTPPKAPKRPPEIKKKKDPVSQAWKAPAGANGRKSVRRSAKRSKKKQRIKKQGSVLLGTYARPSDAEKRALKLKAKGRLVTLKPVAKPGKGVLYQIWLKPSRTN